MMPRKFSYQRNGEVMPTSKAVSDGRNACGEFGIGTVANTPYGHVFGYILRCLEDKDAEIAALHEELAALKQPVAQQVVQEVPAKPYRNMTAGERAAHRKTKES